MYVKDMALLDNKLLTIGLVVLALFVISKIVNDGVTQENLDSVLTVPAPGGTTAEVNAPGSQVNVTQQADGTLIQVTPQPSALPQNLTTAQLAAVQSNISAQPVVTSAPSAALDTSTQPSPLTSVSEDLVAAAPKVTAGQDNIFAPNPVDYDDVFSSRTALDPADLIVKNPDVELYGGIQPDPKLAQNFLNNPFSLGITVSTRGRNSIQDLRGAPPAPKLEIVSPWGQPTQLPDVYRKTLCDVS